MVWQESALCNSVVGKTIYDVKNTDNATLWKIKTGMEEKNGVLAILFFLISMQVSQTCDIFSLYVMIP